MTSDELIKHILATYFSVRIGMAVIALTLPFILWLGGLWYAGLPLQDSMSTYYHAVGPDGHAMRNWFVGILFVVGAFLYLYKGFSQAENIALNIAGVMGWLIALIPSHWNCAPDCDKFSLHGLCAVSFFICIAYVCIFCAKDTLHLIQDPATRERYKRIYNWIGFFMLVSPVGAYVLSVFFHEYKSYTFFVEAFGVIVFALYWLVKSREFALSKAEEIALRGGTI